MKKQTIKLNESQLRNIIKESVKKVLHDNAERHIRFDFSITVPEQYAKKLILMENIGTDWKKKQGVSHFLSANSYIIP